MYNRISFLNAFTANAGGGNPTAVYASRTQLATETMQAMAQELFVPVTAFVWPDGDGYAIRYFTAKTEIGACGHATLAAATVVADGNEADAVRFVTGKRAVIHTTSNGGYTTMRYKSQPMVPAGVGEAMLRSLGITGCKSSHWSPVLKTFFIEVDSATKLRSAKPNFERLMMGEPLAEEVVLTAASDNPRYDYVLRSFCPWIGIDEDHVTGSVHAALAPYWCRKLNKQTLTAYQASARGGEAFLKVQEDEVCISGQAMFVARGGICLGA